VQDALAYLAKRYPIAVKFRGLGWDVQLPARDSFTCELRIGPGAYGWDARVLDPIDGRELWSDWADYPGYNEKNKILERALIEEKQEDIQSFVETWVAATGVRVTSTRTAIFWGLFHRTRVEVKWEHGGLWQPIKLWEEMPPNKRMQLPDASV
jgi:hypothetical protein